MSKPFNPNLPCQTRDGLKVRILCTDGQNPTYPVTGFIDGYFAPSQWTLLGKLYKNNDDDRDLINIPEEPKWRAWKPEEVNPNWTVTRKNGQRTSWIRILYVTVEFVVVVSCQSGPPRLIEVSFDELLEGWEYSNDFGKTRQPCGIQDHAHR